MKKITLLFLTLFIVLNTQGQNQENKAPIIFIYDASGSMWGQLQGKTKMEIAANALSNTVENLSENQKLGLVAYGHRKEGDCEDVEFMVDAASGTKTEVITAVKGIKPLGKTPLAYSAALVIDNLRASKQKATIILITDGIESCDGNICEIVQAAKEEGIDFKLHIIGFGLKEEDTQQLRCAAGAGDGSYFTAENAENLGEILNLATAATVDKPDNNFSVYALKNGKPLDVFVKAYDIVAKRRPIMLRTYQDTGYFYLPPSTYNFEVMPLEGSDVDGITIENIESHENGMGHQTVTFDGGTLDVFISNNGAGWDSMIKILNSQDKVIATARTYGVNKEIEVNPGVYQVAIQALVIKGMHTKTELDSIVIAAGKSSPLRYDFKTGKVEIYAKVAGEDIDSIVTVTEEQGGKNVASGRTYNKGTKFILNTGTYKVHVRPLGANKEKSPQTFSIEVKEGETIAKALDF
ncbi:VWA domain-containing protein [uncultured Cyclobacterium sp.]|uniref:vWA domain-containing protein n=1 Tax=uncultured Cyclobacterium sp. TaxID=453820 RepID=UPI0030EDCF8B|tara:strand:- start:1061 stop:2455 length:1395 start_codon:yes stop_codon:yes gene_type:complete